MTNEYFSSHKFKEELRFRVQYAQLQKDARYYEQGRIEEDGSGFEPYQVVWDILPENWYGKQPICPFFVATSPDSTVPRLLESIHHGQVTVWDVKGYTKQ